MSGIAIIIKGADFSDKALGKVTPIDNEVITLQSLGLTGISELDKDTNTAQLTVAYIPANTNQKGVTFSSNNPDILSVDAKGLVTIVNRPTSDTVVSITVTSEYNSDIKSSIQINVKSALSLTTDGLTMALDAKNADKEQKIIRNDVTGAEFHIASTDTSSTGVVWAEDEITVPAYNRFQPCAIDSDGEDLNTLKGAQDFTIMAVCSVNSNFSTVGDIQVAGFEYDFISDEKVSPKVCLNVKKDLTCCVFVGKYTTSWSYTEYCNTSSEKVQLSKRFVMCLQREEDTLSLYLNNVLISQSTFADALGTQKANIRNNFQKADADSSFCFMGTWNKNLTEEERTQNYEYLKNRFGL